MILIYSFVTISTVKELQIKILEKYIPQFLKSQNIIQIFIFCHLIIFVFLTFFTDNKKFKLKILRFFYKYNFLKFSKIIQLFFLHLKNLANGNDEKIFKKSVHYNKKNEQDFHENIIIGSGPSGLYNWL